MGQGTALCCPGEKNEKEDEQLDALLKKKQLNSLNKSGESDSDSHSNNTHPNHDESIRGDNYKPPEADSDTLLKAWEESIISRDFDNAMALYEEYEGVDFLSHKFTNGDRALHYAVREKNARFVYYLLQKGADPNIASTLSGDLPLHIAVRNQDCRMITILLKWKAKMDIKNGMDQTPKDIAIKDDAEDIIEMFEQKFIKFLHSKDPTPKDYGTKVKPDINKNAGAQEYIVSAFGKADEYEHDESKDVVTENQKILGKKRKKRQLWKPKSMRDVDDGSEYESGEFSSEEDYSTDEDDESNEDKVKKLLGATTNEINDDNNVDDILKSLGHDIVGHNNLGIASTTMRPTTKKPKDKKIKKKENRHSQTMRVGPVSGLSMAKSTPNPKNKSKVPMMSKVKSKMAVRAIDNVSKSKDKLPVLGSWLEKKRYKLPRKWQKRYLCVVDGHLLWDEKKIKIRPHTKLDATERKKYSGSLSLLMVKSIKAHNGKHGSFKFEIEAPNSKVTKRVDYRVYTWKCKTRQLRDDWVKGIKRHCKHLQNELDHFNALY